jgi:hypothetical protein
MTTPKELADKAKDALFAIDDYIARVNGDDRGGDAGVEQLRATIDQLQAMAEARQGSGEPVAWLTGVLGSAGVLTWGDAYVIADAIARVKDTAPPSAGNRTHIADLIDTFEQLRKIAGTPEQDADALIAAVRTLAAAPSAQQATGSGQVLTDEQRQAVEEAAGYFSRSWKSEDAKLANKLRTILAAATQAQPEAREQRLAAAMKRLDKEGPLPGMISAFEQQFGQDWADRDWRNETSVWACAWRAALAAPTTGKREPDESDEELFTFLEGAADGGFVFNDICAGEICLRLFPKRCEELGCYGPNANGITGEPR